MIPCLWKNYDSFWGSSGLHIETLQTVSNSVGIYNGGKVHNPLSDRNTHHNFLQQVHHDRFRSISHSSDQSH